MVDLFVVIFWCAFVFGVIELARRFFCRIGWHEFESTSGGLECRVCHKKGP